MKQLIKELTRENEERIKSAIESFQDELKESDKLTRVEKYSLTRKEPYKRNREMQVVHRVNEVYRKDLTNSLNII